MNKNKFDLSKIDFVQVGIAALGAIAGLARTIYEIKRFDENLNRQYIDHFDERVSKIVDKKLKNRK